MHIISCLFEIFRSRNEKLDNIYCERIEGGKRPKGNSLVKWMRALLK